MMTARTLWTVEATDTLDSLLRWHREVGMLGMPRFCEMGRRLGLMLEQWRSDPIHDSTDAVILQRAQVEELIARLEEIEPPFHSWDEPKDELLSILQVQERSTGATNRCATLTGPLN